MGCACCVVFVVVCVVTDLADCAALSCSARSHPSIWSAACESTPHTDAHRIHSFIGSSRSARSHPFAPAGSSCMSNPFGALASDEEEDALPTATHAAAVPTRPSQPRSEEETNTNNRSRNAQKKASKKKAKRAKRQKRENMVRPHRSGTSSAVCRVVASPSFANIKFALGVFFVSRV